jgi:mono/diheme cytochrome c family protein
MAATDQTYRNIKTTHVVFGVSCLLMLLSVIWMFVQDFNREFKPVQRTFRDVEEGRNLRVMLEQLPRGEELEDKINAAAAARKDYEKAQASLRDKERELTAAREKKDTAYRTIKAFYDSAASYYDMAVDEADKDPSPQHQEAHKKEIEHRLKQRDKLGAELAKAKSELDAADLQLKEEVTAKLAEPKKRMEDAEDDLKRATGAFDRFAKATAQKGWKVGDTIRALPILDSFQSPTKPNQIVLNDLTIDYSFKQVPRFDRCTSCHLGIDRAMFEKASVAALTQPPGELQTSLRRAKRLLLERQRKGEDLGFDPNDLPSEMPTVQLTKADITQFAAHPRLDLFVDSNSPHAMEKFGCTICHGGQGSATSFVLASHTPADARQTAEWKKNHDWMSIHDWDYPMYSNRFVESGCLQCHHQVTDLVRYGSKEEAPKLLKGYNLVKENGCFGCHEISGVKSGRAVGPDLRLEPTPAVELLSPIEQERTRADTLNPPGTLRKVGPSLRRLAEKTNETWTRKWIQAPRSFREDTKMPHFYGLSTNSPEVLPPDQKKFPDAEIYAIAHYLFAESNDFLKAGNEDELKAGDTYRRTLIDVLEEMHSAFKPAGIKNLTDEEKVEYDPLEEKRKDKELTVRKERDQWAKLDRKVRGRPLSEKERKELSEATRGLSYVALQSEPTKSVEINTAVAELRQLQERVQQWHSELDELRGKTPEALEDANNAELQDLLVVRLNAATAQLIKLGKPITLKQRVVDYEGKEVAKDTILKGDGDRGNKLFIEKGCMACHSHTATEPAVIGEGNFGPNLSRIAAKLGTENGDEESKRRWLVQWLLNPNIHHPRTRMPITFLQPQDASDIATWLLSQKANYTEEGPAKPTNETLVEMARLYLSKAPGMTAADVDRYLPKSKDTDALPPGISDNAKTFMARDADEQALVTAKGAAVTPEKLKWYIGKKSINRLGCYGCHDIPGFEQSKPIGTALNDWGKKDPERLAFEDSDAFVKDHYNIVENRDDVKDKTKADPKWKSNQVVENGETIKKEPFERYFADAVEHHHRDGFLHLKLEAPRSFDYKRIRTWDDRLRMPQFQFSRPRRHKDESDDEYEVRRSRDEAEAREAVMTFILGLVAEPIALKYLANPSPDRAAEVKGRQVIEKFNCAGCHQVRPGVYEFKPTKDAVNRLERAFNRAAGNTDSDKSLPALKSDHVFAMHNAWVGTPSPYPDRMMAFGVNPKSGEMEREDNPDVKDKVLTIRLSDALRFTNNEHVVRDIPASSEAVAIAERDLLTRSDPWGGAFVHLLVGAQNDDGDWQGYLTKAGLFKGKPDDARSTLPPPLIREGERVQTKWLYSFLLNPTPIRPETHMKLRMPRFNMSPEEAQAIVNYFAAASKTGNPGLGLTYPYETVPQREKRYWAERSDEYIKTIDKGGDAALEARANAQMKDLDAQLADAKKAEKKDDKLIADLESKIKTLKGEIDKKNWKDLRKQWLTGDVYQKDAYKLLTNRNICLKCHSIGDIKIEGAVGPPLDLTAERLRPEWTQEWLSNPKRLFSYNTQMPQNFPNDKKILRKEDGRELSTDYLESFYGSPREQARAVRDALMDLPELRKPAGAK